MNFTSDTTQRLDKFLASAITSVSRGRIQTEIKSGKVQVNGVVQTEPDFTLRPNDAVELDEIKPEALELLEMDLKIVFENEYMLVIDKPASLVVHPGAGHKQDTLSNVLLSKYPEIANVGDPHRPGIVHRLDEDTSGLILAAKTQQGYDYLKNLFLTRDIEKKYITLVHGIPAKLHDNIDIPIGRSSTHPKMKTGIGKPALTEYTVISQSPEKDGLDSYALLKVKLHTGRTHQIRVHMAHVGHPVVGDQTYGGMNKIPDQALIQRQFLHAANLKFKLPDGTTIDLFSELPDELIEVLQKVGIDYKPNNL